MREVRLQTARVLKAAFLKLHKGTTMVVTLTKYLQRMV